MASTIEEFGRRKSLLFQGFVYFAHLRARALGLERLHFITREGVFFRAVYRSLFSDRIDGHDPLDTSLLEASRQSTFGPAVAATGHGDLSRLWNLYPRITPQAFLKSLNLDEEMFASKFEHFGLPIGELVERPWSDPKFERVIRDTSFQRDMMRSLDRDREAALAYFSPRFEGLESIGLVEIGWQGSIQDNLALLFPERQFHGTYLGLAIAKNPALPNSFKKAFGPDRNLSNADRHLLDAINVMEFICLSQGGSVCRYHRDGSGTAVAERSRRDVEDALLQEFSELFQTGVIQAGSRTRFDELGRLHSKGELKSLALAEWRDILSQPQADLVRTYFALKSNEEFGMGEFRDQSQTPSWQTILAAPFKPTSRRRLIRYLTYSQWAAGMRARGDLGTLKRLVLSGLMRIALKVKSLIHGRASRKT